MAHALCMLNNKGYQETLRICYIYCLSTAKMITPSRLSHTLRVQCLSCWSPNGLVDSVVIAEVRTALQYFTAA